MVGETKVFFLDVLVICRLEYLFVIVLPLLCSRLSLFALLCRTSVTSRLEEWQLSFWLRLFGLL